MVLVGEADMAIYIYIESRVTICEYKKEFRHASIALAIHHPQ